jgi:hypothetical protein
MVGEDGERRPVAVKNRIEARRLLEHVARADTVIGSLSAARERTALAAPEPEI